MKKREFDPIPLFLSEYKQLRRKFPSIRKELDDFEEHIRNPENKLLGVPIPGINNLKGNKVFKYRMPNKTANRGKSGGFRIIYYYVTADLIVHPLTIYSKTELPDVPPHVIERIIRNNFSN